jgi:hypothetical protein
MSDECETRLERSTARGRAAGVVAVVMFFAALYVASIGPVVAWLQLSSAGIAARASNPLWYQAIWVFYAPLVWLVDSGTAPGRWLWEYAKWWCSP